LNETVTQDKKNISNTEPKRGGRKEEEEEEEEL
jgi:hypothetical protein